MIGFEDILFQKLWLLLPLWVLVYGLDYYLTLVGAHYYKAGANEHFAVEGSYELTPEYEETIDAGRKFSPKFIKALVLSSVLIAGLWALSQVGASSAPICPKCGIPLVVRDSRRSQFYGCSNYPRCRQTAPLNKII